MVTIYVVRHGTTEANAKGIIQGQLDTPLTEKGKQDAQLLAKKLEGIQFDHIYSSDLGRAFITEFIIAQLDHEIDKISEVPQLREVDYGDVSNENKKQMLADLGEKYYDPDYQFPRGESRRQAQERAVGFFEELKQQHTSETILVVTHSGIIRALKDHYTDADYNELLHQSVPHEYIGIYDLTNTTTYKEI